MNSSIGSARCRIMIRDPSVAGVGLEIDDFDLPPFSQLGGLGRAHQLFGAELPPLLVSLTASLAA